MFQLGCPDGQLACFGSVIVTEPMVIPVACVLVEVLEPVGIVEVTFVLTFVIVGGDGFHVKLGIDEIGEGKGK